MQPLLMTTQISQPCHRLSTRGLDSEEKIACTFTPTSGVSRNSPTTAPDAVECIRQNRRSQLRCSSGSGPSGSSASR